MSLTPTPSEHEPSVILEDVGSDGDMRERWVFRCTCGVHQIYAHPAVAMGSMQGHMLKYKLADRITLCKLCDSWGRMAQTSTKELQDAQDRLPNDECAFCRGSGFVNQQQKADVDAYLQNLKNDLLGYLGEHDHQRQARSRRA